jgi:hypothetical protein
MAEYKTFLDKMVENYACRKRSEDIENYVADQMQKKLHIKYKKTYVKEYPAFVSKPHPLGGGMENWSVNPDPKLMDVEDLAERILGDNQYGVDVRMTTYPRLGSRQYLDPYNYDCLKPMVKGHEIRHYLAHAMPFNLAYIYGSKVLDSARRANMQLSKEDLASEIMRWLNQEYAPNYSRLDYLKERVDDYDKYLDDMENEKNIYYSCPDIERKLLDDYKAFIDEMDFE